LNYRPTWSQYHHCLAVKKCQPLQLSFIHSRAIDVLIASIADVVISRAADAEWADSSL